MDNQRKPKVLVLLSTFNGQRFVEALIKSVLIQSEVEITLLIRDDGSTDKTVAILEEYASNHPAIHLLKGGNLGVVDSFFELLKQAAGADYYAFADQDDVWKPDKLTAAIKHLEQVDSQCPALYYSRLEFVDEDLKHIGFSAIPDFSGFKNALVQNQATGCTIVMNDSARSKITTKLPDWALMHDWWCYLVISAFGVVVYDVNSYILYRKHGKNVTPATPFFALELLARVKRYLGDGTITQKVTDQVREFNRLYGSELSNINRALATEFLDARNSGFFKRLLYVLFQQRVKRNTRLDNLILKLLIVRGKF